MGGGNSYRNHFIHDMFDILLATPCSALFLETAVAFALGADYFVLFLVFTALAIFDFMMLATSLWLLSLMTSFIRTLTTLMIGLIYIAGLLGQLGQIKGHRSVILTLAFLCLISATGLLASFTTGRLSTGSTAEIQWQPLETEAIQEAVKQGKTVFLYYR